MTYQDKLDRAKWVRENFIPQDRVYTGPCTHVADKRTGRKGAVLTTGDLYHCQDCQASRGVDGEWRN